MRALAIIPFLLVTQATAYEDLGLIHEYRLRVHGFHYNCGPLGCGWFFLIDSPSPTPEAPDSKDSICSGNNIGREDTGNYTFGCSPISDTQVAIAIVDTTDKVQLLSLKYEATLDDGRHFEYVGNDSYVTPYGESLLDDEVEFTVSMWNVTGGYMGTENETYPVGQDPRS